MPSTRWQSNHCGLSSPPRISIQWAVIVKYSFMHLEFHRSHVKAGFASFQLLSLLNLLILSAYKLDICKSIQAHKSKKPCNKSLHYHNTNQISTAIKIVAKKKNKTMQWKKETRTTQEETRKQHLQSKFPTSAVIPFLPKSGHLGSKLLVIALNTVVYTVQYGRQLAAIHFPINLLTQWYATLSTL